nr:MAG TPA: hypothetical protein [Caudoviricetes sp.]DAQ88253.1 MAG TPA: hypothetical protein [Caudoviricetes sp.]DAS14550.1 MAG TPA: hypothetical protein [Caudoviricetes sp.]
MILLPVGGYSRVSSLISFLYSESVTTPLPAR